MEDRAVILCSNADCETKTLWRAAPMEVSHTPLDKPTPRDAWTALNDLLRRVNALRKKYESSDGCEFEDFDRQLHALFAQTECAVAEEALALHDVDLPFVFIDGEMYRRACR